MKEFKVGEKIILEVTETEDVTCKGCFFCVLCRPLTVHCADLCMVVNPSRGKYIIFKEVKE